MKYEEEYSRSTKLKTDLLSSNAMLQEQCQRCEKSEKKNLSLTKEVKCLEKLCARYKSELECIKFKEKQSKGDGDMTLSQLQGDLKEQTQKVGL